MLSDFVTSSPDNHHEDDSMNDHPSMQMCDSLDETTFDNNMDSNAGTMNSASSSSNLEHPPPDPLAKLTVNIIIPSSCVGILIGKGGAHIKEINEESKCKVIIRDASLSSNTEERIVSIVGILENITSAERLIIEKIKQYRPYSNHETELDDQENLKWLIPSESVGALIGKGGNGIASIVEQTGGCKVKISQLEDMPAGSKERLVTVTGPMEAAKKAIGLIQDVVGGRDATNLHGTTSGGKIFSIPNRAVGSLIGKGGSIIKQLCDESGAKIKIISQEDLPFGGSDRPLHIRGNDEQIELAERLIQKKVDDFLLADQGNEITNSEITLKMMIPGDSIGRLIGKGGASIREITEQSGALVRVLTEGEILPVSARVLLLHGLQENVLKAQYLILCRLQSAFIQQSFSSSSSSILPLSNRSNALYPSNFDSTPFYGGVLGSSNPLLPSCNGNITFHISVPTSMIGFIIGKKGNTVKEMKKMSGAEIHLAPETDDSQDLRKVVLVGNIVQIAAANSLIQAKLASAAAGKLKGGKTKTTAAASTSQQTSGGQDSSTTTLSGSQIAPISYYPQHYQAYLAALEQQNAFSPYNVANNPQGLLLYPSLSSTTDKNMNQYGKAPGRREKNKQHNLHGPYNPIFSNSYSSMLSQDSQAFPIHPFNSTQQQHQQIAAVQSMMSSRNQYGYDSKTQEQFQIQMQIPINMIGTIIGKSGNTFKKLKAQSGAQLKLENEVPGESSRKMVVSGNPMQVQLAQQLINQVLAKSARYC